MGRVAASGRRAAALLASLPPAVPTTRACTEAAEPDEQPSRAMSFSLNTTGGVASRFVSQKDLDEAKANKDKEWAEAYARCVACSGSSSGRRPTSTSLC